MSEQEPIGEGLRPEDVFLYMDHWVSGTRARCYLGPVAICLHKPTGVDFSDIVFEGMAAARVKLGSLGCNAGVSMEQSLEALEDGIHYKLVCTGAVLELFCGATAKRDVCGREPNFPGEYRTWNPAST